MRQEPLPTEKYEPRTIKFIKVFWHDPWHLKLYVVAEGNILSKATEEHLTSLAEIVDSVERERGQHCYGVLIIHRTTHWDYLTLLSWENGNEFVPYVWRRRPNDTEWTRTETRLCRWDMHVGSHENKLWATHVLQGHDIEGYLQRHVDMETV